MVICFFFFVIEEVFTYFLSVLDTEGLITQALLLNNVEAAVELCLKAKRFADALIIATTGNTIITVQLVKI